MPGAFCSSFYQEIHNCACDVPLNPCYSVIAITLCFASTSSRILVNRRMFCITQNNVKYQRVSFKQCQSRYLRSLNAVSSTQYISAWEQRRSTAVRPCGSKTLLRQLPWKLSWDCLHSIDDEWFEGRTCFEVNAWPRLACKTTKIYMLHETGSVQVGT